MNETTTQTNENYLALLKEFNTYTFYDNLLETRNYVSMDNIHDAIITVGVSMDAPITHYVVKAKQYAINEYNAQNRRYRIVMENVSRWLDSAFEFDGLGEYGFTSEELDIVMEIVQGIAAYKSTTPRRRRKKIIESIKKKIRATL